MKVLITGSNGQLGRALQKEFPDAKFTDTKELDITDQKQVKVEVKEGKFDVIINAAAYTAVDGAELDENKEIVEAVNVEGVKNLALAANQTEAVLVHISTEYVFDGKKEGPYTEEDTTNPLSVYGKSKLDSEAAAMLAPKFYIVRTSWVVGDGGNFVRTMMGLANKGIDPTVVNDQIGRLSFATDLAKAIAMILKSQPEFGIYNVTNTGQPASWAEVTRQIFSLMGKDNTVTDTTTEQYFADKPQAATRPKNSVLDLTKAANIGITLPDWHDSLAKYIKGETSQ